MSRSKSLSAPKKGPAVDPKLVHHYVPRERWPSSDPPCARPDCERPQVSRYHDVPEPDPEVAKVEARKLGELDQQS